MEHQENYYEKNDWQSDNIPNERPATSVNRMALTSMIIGIFGLLVACCIPPLQFLLGVTSLLLAIFSKKGKPLHGYAIAGLILSILCILISIAVIAYIALVYNMAKDPQYGPLFNELYELYQISSIK